RGSRAVRDTSLAMFVHGHQETSAVAQRQRPAPIAAASCAIRTVTATRYPAFVGGPGGCPEHLSERRRGRDRTSGFGRLEQTGRAAAPCGIAACVEASKPPDRR